MVRSNRKSRFGVVSSHTVRRPLFPYQSLCADQHIVIDTLKSDKTGCIKQHGHITVSMNKKKRWQWTADTLMEELSSSDCTVVISQHHLQPREKPGSVDCLYVCSQNKTKTVKVKEANNTYARVQDLKDELEQDENSLPEQRERRRRGYKRRRHQRQVTGEEDGEGDGETMIHCKMYSVPSRRRFQIQPPKATYSSKSSKKRNGVPGGNLSFFEDIYEDEVWAEQEDEEAIKESLVTSATECDTVPCIPSEQCLADFILHREETVSRKDHEVPRNGLTKREVKKNGTSHKGHLYYVDKSEYLLPSALEAAICPQMVERSKGQGWKKKKRSKILEPAVVTPPSYNGDCPTFLALVDPDSLYAIQTAADQAFGHPVFVWGQSLPERFVINVTSYISDMLANEGFNSSIRAIQESRKEWSILVERYNDDSRSDTAEKVKNLYDHPTRTNSVIRLTLIGFPRAHTTELMTSYELKQTDDIYSFDINEVLLIMKKHIDQLSLTKFLAPNPLPCGRPNVTIEVISKALDWKSSNVILTPKQLVNLMAADKQVCVKDASSHMKEFWQPLGCTGLIDCGICLKSVLISSDGVSSDATALKTCLHWFCNDCWRHYLRSRMDYGVVNLTCPAYGCKTEVDIVTLMTFLSSASYSQHRRRELEAARVSHGYLEWCPREGCSYLLEGDRRSTVLAEEAGAGAVTSRLVCACGGTWCACCKDKFHWPATCQQNSLYKEKFGGNFKRGNITHVTVKNCPSCRYPLEKSGGCMAVVCRCSYTFCWSCCKDWSNSHYSCKVGERLTQEVDLVDIIKLSSNYDRALLHRDRCTRSAVSARKTQAKTLLSKLTYAREHCNTSCGNKCIGQNRIARLSEVLDGVLKFCSEVEFVLEHLEIYLTRRKAMNRSKAHFISETNDRLSYISNQIHQILEQKTSFDILTVSERLATLTNAGKQNLHNLACTLKKTSSPEFSHSDPLEFTD